MDRTDRDRRRDERDLAILQLASVGVSEHEIARELRCKRRVVRQVIAADARAFPDEPLSVNTLALQPGGCA